MESTFSLLVSAVACAGAATAAPIAWALARRFHAARLQQLAARHASLCEAAARFEQQTRLQISALRAELAVERARSRAAEQSTAQAQQQVRAAQLEAALAQEACRPRSDDDCFADTRPLEL